MSIERKTGRDGSVWLWDTATGRCTRIKEPTKTEEEIAATDRAAKVKARREARKRRKAT